MAFARQNGGQHEETVSLAVRGWQNSKAANNDDGGVQSLKTFLNKKASRPVLSASVRGDALVITVKAADVPRFTHLNNFTWAGTTLSVEQSNASVSQSNAPVSRGNQSRGHQPVQPPTGPRHHNNSQRFNEPNGSAHNNNNHNGDNGNHRNNNNHNGDNGNHRNNRAGANGHRGKPRTDGDNVVMDGSPFAAPTAQPTNPEAVQAVIASVIRKRYNAEQKYLTLESLALDPDFQAIGLSNQSAAKVFAALFTTCETSVFETQDKRKAMIESLSLSNNSLTSVKDVIAAASTFHHIKNLDLSNNKISSLDDIKYWRNRFRGLEHLILAGNPIERVPDLANTLKRWYPKLTMYNNAPLGAPAVGALVQGDVTRTFTPPPAGFTTDPLPTEPHPEFGPGSTFGVAIPNKSSEQLIKEQMGLRFSYETRLKMQWVEQCLTANNFNYDAAVADLQNAIAAGTIPSDAFLAV